MNKDIKQIKQKLLNKPYYYIKHQPENIQNELLQDENFVLKILIMLLIIMKIFLLN